MKNQIEVRKLIHVRDVEARAKIKIAALFQRYGWMGYAMSAGVAASALASIRAILTAPENNPE